KRNNKIPVNVSPLCTNGVWTWHDCDQVGRAELPIARPLWPWRKICGRAFDHSILDPLRDDPELFCIEATLAKKEPGVFRRPWGHVAGMRDRKYILCMLLNVAIGQERKGGRLSRAMTARTMLENDRGN